MSEEKKLPDCPVCGGSDPTLFMQGIFDCEATRVLECRGCGLQYLDPMMSAQEEEEYYRDYYLSQASRHYRQMSHQAIQERALGHYERYRERYLGVTPAQGELLEIGSGSGGFLRFLQQHRPGLGLTSVERSPSNRAFLEDDRLNSFAGVSFYAELDEIEGRRYDAVVALGVFEHVRESVPFLTRLRALLRDDRSRIVLNVPNKHHPLIYRYGVEPFKKFNYMKQHYYTFTKRSLELLAERAGLTLERCHHLQAWSLDNHLSWLVHGRPRDFSDLTALFSPATLRAYDEDLSDRGVGDLMMVILKRQESGGGA